MPSHPTNFHSLIVGASKYAKYRSQSISKRHPFRQYKQWDVYRFTEEAHVKDCSLCGRVNYSSVQSAQIGLESLLKLSDLTCEDVALRLVTTKRKFYCRTKRTSFNITCGERHNWSTITEQEAELLKVAETSATWNVLVLDMSGLLELVK